MEEAKIVLKAEFNPRIKSYIFVFSAFILAITIVGIPLLLIWFLGLGKYISRCYYDNLKCQLTTRHLKYKKGILFKVEKTIPLENIQDLTFIENPILNYFDLRILKIETAGSSNPQGADMKLVGIVRSAEFKKKVLLQRELLLAENNGRAMFTDESSDETLVILKEIRDLLSDIKQS
ncbi:MAG: PH domain-containing protein [Crocinitomicaceae bacterium]|nr:PH domain-containing protein [Crocinitomicaceae bacterium]